MIRIPQDTALPPAFHTNYPLANCAFRQNSCFAVFPRFPVGFRQKTCGNAACLGDGRDIRSLFRLICLSAVLFSPCAGGFRPAPGSAVPENVMTDVQTRGRRRGKAADLCANTFRARFRFYRRNGRILLKKYAGGRKNRKFPIYIMWFLVYNTLNTEAGNVALAE